MNEIISRWHRKCAVDLQPARQLWVCELLAFNIRSLQLTSLYKQAALRLNAFHNGNKQHLRGRWVRHRWLQRQSKS